MNAMPNRRHAAQLPHEARLLAPRRICSRAANRAAFPISIVAAMIQGSALATLRSHAARLRSSGTRKRESSGRFNPQRIVRRLFSKALRPFCTKPSSNVEAADEARCAFSLTCDSRAKLSGSNIYPRIVYLKVELLSSRRGHLLNARIFSGPANYRDPGA